MRRGVLALFLTFVALTSSAQSSDTFEVSVAGGKSIPTWHGQADLQALKVAVVHPLSQRSDLLFMVAPVNLWQPRSWFGNQFNDGNENVRGLATALLWRRTFHRQSERMQWFIEGGTGPMFSQKRVPASTSRFNFMSQAAAGLVLMPNSRLPLLLGYRFLHISNGGYAPRNPGLNVSSAEVGVRLRTARPRRR